MVKRQRMLTLLTGLACCVMAGAASAAVDKVICVPWQGDVAKYHTTVSGSAAQLKCVVKTTNNSTIYYKWLFGDGAESTMGTINNATKYNIETTHTYTGAVGTPFTAKLVVSDNNAFTPAKEDVYLLKIETNDINAQINIAIDTGLWWLYKNGNADYYVYTYAHTYDGSPLMAWRQGSHLNTLGAPTASALHAFGINGHKYKNNPDEDPYVESVRGGMNYLVKGYFQSSNLPELHAVNIAGTASDVNANGYGIEVYGWPGSSRTPYQGGQIMDAIIASGVAPADSTGRDFSGRGTPWTYAELLQDMADMHAWGQWDSACPAITSGICGSWWYDWNYGSPGDNSASQWPAIGMLPAQEPPWNVVVPAWVKTYNANWLAYSRCDSGSNYFFSYNGRCGCAGDSCLQTTTSAMVQMIFAGQTTADPKWAPAQRYIADLWKNFTHDGSTWGGSKTYGWYSFAKAMRLAKPAPVTQLLKSSGASFDWYYGNPLNAACTSEATCQQGLAPRIIEIQTKSGASTGAWESGNLSDTPLTTAWMIITLRPTLFAAAPIACFNATPNPSFADQPVTFDPSCSGHSEAGKDIVNLKLFEWDWNNDGTYDASSATPVPQLHSFACAVLPCSYPVTLRVTDDNNPALTATTVVNVNITNPPHPPVADAGGPYMVSSCSADSLLLDGSASFDQDEGLFQAGCTTCPGDTITAWDWDLVPPLTGFTDKAGETVTLNSAAIATYFPAGAHSIGLRVTDNTLLSYPGSGQPNLTNANFTTLSATNGCMCNLAARAKSGKIQLTWTSVGAPSYDVYRSTLGPNTGFAKLATVATTYATYLDGTVVNGTKYYYRVIASTGCGSLAASATATAR